jgi:hypothetical protein
MSWEIRANLGRYARTGADAAGWLWEITRGDEAARVLVEISGSAWAAWASDPLRLPEETRKALETDGRTEMLKVLDHENPPQAIRCGSMGCTYLSGKEVRR